MLLADWKSKNPDDQAAWIERLCAALPIALHPQQVCTSKSGRMQCLAGLDREWIFVPGGQITLGWGAMRWAPNAGDLEDWHQFHADYGTVGGPATIHEFMQQALFPCRTINAPALIVERHAHTVSHVRKNVVTHAQVLKDALDRGLRLPSSDEWSWLCAGNCASLFHWGDDTRLPRRAENNFSLHIPTESSYHYELVMEEGIFRGADGGASSCGGLPEFFEDVTKATAFSQPGVCAYEPGEHLATDYVRCRWVIPLPSDLPIV